MKRLFHVGTVVGDKSSVFSLPRDVVTQTVIVYGNKGAGKTNLCAVIAEELYAAGAKFSVLDPVGVSWGLQHGASKAADGLEVLVLGGRHGDIPITPSAGRVVADLVVDESVSTVIDISRDQHGKKWKQRDRISFVTDYISQLHERQGEKRRPIMQLIDEAARFIPQEIPRHAVDISSCVSVIEQLVEEGRNDGIGVCLITQRSARMKKSVSELAECMFAFRTIGPNSVNAIMDWLGEHIPKSRWASMVQDLRSLPRGRALVVSPGWMDFEGFVDVRLRSTFDSSSTPRAGQEAKASSRARKPNLQRYLDRMAETVQAIQENDPLQLKKQVADLKKQLTAAVQRPAVRVVDPIKPLKLPKQVVKVIPLTREVKKLGWLQSRLCAALSESSALADKLAPAVDQLGRKLATFDRAVAEPVPEPSRRQTTASLPPPITKPVVKRTPEPNVGQSVELSKAAKAMLFVLACRYPEPVNRGQLSTLSVYSIKSSSFKNGLSALRTAGLIEEPSANEFLATDEGRRVNGPTPGAVSGVSRAAEWLQKLDKAPATMLRALIERYPSYLNRAALSEAAGYSPTSSSFKNGLSALRTRKLIEMKSDDSFRAASELAQ